MTTRTIFWRLFWKEYRLQRALWVAMAVLTAMLLGIEFAVVDPPEKIPWMFWLASVFSAIYPLGCGATLFAGEHEAGAYQFQRSLPVEARLVFLVKMLFAVVNTAILFGSTWLLAAFLSDWKIPKQAQGELPALWAAFGLLALLWTAFFSLLLKRVLTAAVLGGTASFVSIVIAIELAFQPFNVPDAPVLSVLIRLVALAAIVALLDLWLGTQWFREPRRDRLRSLLLTLGSDASSAGDDRRRRPKARAIVGRLLWQHGKQNARILAFLLGIQMFCLPVAFATVWTLHTNPFVIGSIEMWALSVPAILWGVYTFHADQNGNSFHFLADRGVKPKYIWLSRQLLMLLSVVLVQFVALQATGFAAAGALLHAWPSFTHVCWEFLFLFVSPVILAVCVGQLFSMFIRSAILAVVFSVLLTNVLAAWCSLMQGWGVNWLWSELPIPIALLLATRLRTRYWLLERNDWRAWLPSALALVVPTVVILTCVAFHRAYEIPLVDPGFSPDEFRSPDDGARAQDARSLPTALGQGQRGNDQFGPRSKPGHAPSCRGHAA